MGHNKNHKPDGEGAKIMHCGPGHQVGGGTFLSKHCASSNYKDKPAGGYQPLNYMSASYNDMGDSNKPQGKIAQKGGKKPDANGNGVPDYAEDGIGKS